MSLIPKINIGLRTKKSGRNVSCMTHGTSEIGYVYPTYCREYINDATIKISSRTGVRFSPLFVPTMGKLSVRHYYRFVPYNRVWTAFDAYLSHQPYAFSSGVAIPSTLLNFKTKDVIGKLLNDECYLASQNPLNADPFVPDISRFIADSKIAKWLTCSIYKKTDSGYENVHVSSSTDNVFFVNVFRNLNPWNYAVTPALIANYDGDSSDIYFVTYNSTFQYKLFQLGDSNLTFYNNDVDDYLSRVSFPSLKHCDWSYQVNYDGNTYIVCFNWNGALKRLRSVFLGLGYSFNPFDEENDNALKLLAYYRTYFSLFGITRNMNFNDTACAKVSRFINSNICDDILCKNSNQNGTGGAGGIGQLFFEFILSLLDLPYTCPPDYFSSAMQNPSVGSDNMSMSSQISASRTINVTNDSTYGVQPSFNAVAIKMAQKMLKMVNVNGVVGKKIADILHAQYGDIKVDDESSEGVFPVGVDETPIEIGAIYNQSGSGSTPLGDYAGVATGGSRSKHPYKFTTPSFGCLVCVTAVVPEMGYFQGKLRENSHGVGDYLEFYKPIYDAMGWTPVRYNELIADRSNLASGLPSGTSLGALGYQPRYTHLKCAFNRCIGDVSLPHMIDSMLPYTLDRYFDPRSTTLPTNSPDYLRRGDIGDTNRIFDSVSPTDDHIIYQIYFDISVNDSMKSLSSSYDTLTSDDNSSIEVNHE